MTPQARAPAGRTVTAGMLAIALTYAGCSVSKHYDTLSFFFDGVPEPRLDGESASGGTRRGAQPGVATVASSHSAYTDRRCTECHGDRARFGFQTSGFSQIGESVCVTCHEIDPAPYTHGPVAIGSCLLCHQPHASPHPALLVASTPPLCLGCHTPGAGQVDGPDHADLDRSCLDCHFGHGGDDPQYLRPSYRSSTGDAAGDG